MDNLRAQIFSLRSDLGWAETTLQSSLLTDDVRKAFQARFAGFIHVQRQNLDDLLKSIESGGPTDASWGKLSRCQKECAALFSECLAVIGGATLRRHGEEVSICLIADALLAELSERVGITWDRFTIPAEVDFFTEATGIVRLRYPFHDIWQLPVAAHELGHYMAPRITDFNNNLLFEEHLKGFMKAAERSHAKEFFADLFAIHALGPAYACTCVFLRFNPRAELAGKDTETHPSFVKRVYFMLKAMDQVKEYEQVTADLRAAWQQAAAAVKLDADPGGDERVQLDKLFAAQNSILRHIAPSRYSNWYQIGGLAAKLASEEVSRATCGDRCNLTDVVNAAWMARLLRDDQLTAVIGRRAVELCKEIAAAGSPL